MERLFAHCYDAHMPDYGQITGADGVEGSWLIDLNEIGVPG